MYGDYNGEWGFKPNDHKVPTRNDLVSSEITYNGSIRCGDCNGPASSHPIQYVCYRDPLEVGDTYRERYEDTELGHFSPHDRLNDLPITQSGSETPVDKRSDRWAIEPEVSDGSNGRYDDLNPEEHTVTLQEYRNGKRPNVSLQPERRNVYLEGLDGYQAINVYDPRLTAMYQARLLNVFRDKNTNRLRVGSVQIIPLSDGTIEARCVNLKAGCDGSIVEEGPHKGKSRGVLNINPEVATREEMEDFILDIIRHGNNHVHHFIKNRVNDFSDKRINLSSTIVSLRSEIFSDLATALALAENDEFNIVDTTTQSVVERPTSDWYEINPFLPRKVDIEALIAHFNSKELQVA